MDRAIIWIPDARLTPKITKKNRNQRYLRIFFSFCHIPRIFLGTRSIFPRTCSICPHHLRHCRP